MLQVDDRADGSDPARHRYVHRGAAVASEVKRARDTGDGVELDRAHRGVAPARPGPLPSSRRLHGHRRSARVRAKQLEAPAVDGDRGADAVHGDLTPAHTRRFRGAFPPGVGTGRGGHADGHHDGLDRLAGDYEIAELGSPRDRRGLAAACQLRRHGGPSSRLADGHGPAQLPKIARCSAAHRELGAGGKAAVDGRREAAPGGLGSDHVDAAVADPAFRGCRARAEIGQGPGKHDLAQVERDGGAPARSGDGLEAAPQRSPSDAGSNVVDAEPVIHPLTIDGDLPDRDLAERQLRNTDLAGDARGFRGAGDLGGDSCRAADRLIDLGDPRERLDRHVPRRAQGERAGGRPRVAQLSFELHRLAMPAPADLSDPDHVRREPAVDHDLVDLLATAGGVRAEHIEAARDVGVSRRRPGDDVSARDLDGQRGLRMVDHGVAALHPDAPDADADGARLDVLGEREESGATRLCIGRRHLEVDIARERGDGELPAPQARDVDAHVDGRRAEADATGRRRARRYQEVDDRHPRAPRGDTHVSHASRLPQRIGEQRLDAFARERGAQDVDDGPRARDDDAHRRQEGEYRHVPPAKSCDPHRFDRVYPSGGGPAPGRAQGDDPHRREDAEIGEAPRAALPRRHGAVGTSQRSGRAVSVDSVHGVFESWAHLRA